LEKADHDATFHREPLIDLRELGLKLGRAAECDDLRLTLGRLRRLLVLMRFMIAERHRHMAPDLTDKAKNRSSGAWHICWMYGPNEVRDGKDVAVITVLVVGQRL
jgi:hypothetical protein